MKRAEARFSPSIILQSVLALGMLVLVFELHMLRTTVEDDEASAAIDDGGGVTAKLEAVFDRLLARIEPKPTPAHVTPTGDARRGPEPGAGKRTLLATNLETRLTELTQAIQRLAASSGRSTVPSFMSTIAPMNTRAVIASHAELRKNKDVAKRSFLLLSRADLLARFGKPVSIGVHPDGSIQWRYLVTDGVDSKGIGFRLHDGYVVDVY